MDFDPSFIDAIKGFEGFSPNASWDYQQYSNGYGTRAAGPNETIDRATAEQRLTDELTKAASKVDAMGVDMPPGARNALISLTYNAGPGWMQSGLGDLVKAGDWAGAAQRLQDYNKAGGRENAGLTKRRAVEASWITAGGEPSPNGPLGANTVAQAKPASLPLFGAPQSSPSPSFSGLPAGQASASPGQAGAGGGSDDLSSMLLAAAQPSPLGFLAPYRYGAHSLRAIFPRKA